MNETYGLAFHHLGLAAAEPEQTVRFLTQLGYRVSEEVFDPLQNANLRWCSHPQLLAIEIIYAADEPGPLASILSGQRESFYHVAFESADLEQSVAAMKADGFRVMCVSPAKPAVLFESRKVAFYYIRGFGLVEIVNTAA